MNELEEIKKAFNAIVRSTTAAINSIDSALSLAAPIIEHKVAELEMRVERLEEENRKLRANNGD